MLNVLGVELQPFHRVKSSIIPQQQTTHNKQTKVRGNIMKVVFNNGGDFLDVQMDCVPRVNEIIYYDDIEFTVRQVEYCVNDGGLCHVNLILKITNS